MLRRKNQCSKLCLGSNDRSPVAHTLVCLVEHGLISPLVLEWQNILASSRGNSCGLSPWGGICMLIKNFYQILQRWKKPPPPPISISGHNGLTLFLEGDGQLYVIRRWSWKVTHMWTLYHLISLHNKPPQRFMLQTINIYYCLLVCRSAGQLYWFRMRWADLSWVYSWTCDQIVVGWRLVSLGWPHSHI